MSSSFPALSFTEEGVLTGLLRATWRPSFEFKIKRTSKTSSPWWYLMQFFENIRGKTKHLMNKSFNKVRLSKTEAGEIISGCPWGRVTARQQFSSLERRWGSTLNCEMWLMSLLSREQKRNMVIHSAFGRSKTLEPPAGDKILNLHCGVEIWIHQVLVSELLW